MGIRNLIDYPVKAIKEESFFIDSPTFLGRTPLGCSVDICEKVKNNVNYWKITPNMCASNYYFPWLPNFPGYVGISQLQNNCIVVTNGMNGCALEVCIKDGIYYFYHDANGKSMDKINDKGTMVCRIEADAYFDSDKMLHNVPEKSTPIVQFVCIYKDQFWHVGCFGIYFRGSMMESPKTIVGSFIPKGGKYRGRFNDTIHLIQR